jgi:hypothetical protein
MKSDPKERALEICLQQLHRGATVEQALAGYPQWRDELRPLLEAGEAAQRLGATQKHSSVTKQQDNSERSLEAAQARSRSQFLTAAQRYTVVERAQPQRQLFGSSRWRWGLALLTLTVVIVMGALQTIKVAAHALPGDSLYPLKLVSEQTRLLLSPSAGQRLTLEQSFDQERAEEVEELIQRDHYSVISGEPINFVGVLQVINSSEWQVGTAKVLVVENTQLIGEIIPGYWVEVNGVLQANGQIVAEQIRLRNYELIGKLQKVQDSLWTVEGVEFRITPETLWPTGKALVPVTGSTVKVSLLQKADGVFLARWVGFVGSNNSTDGKINPMVTNDDATGAIETESGNETIHLPTLSPEGREPLATPQVTEISPQSKSAPKNSQGDSSAAADTPETEQKDALEHNSPRPHELDEHATAGDHEQPEARQPSQSERSENENGSEKSSAPSD